MGQYFHVGLCRLYFIGIHVFGEKRWEVLFQDFSNRQLSCFIDPLLEFFCLLTDSFALISDWLILQLLVELDIGMMRIGEDSYGVPTKVSDVLHHDRVVNLPEVFVIILEETVLDHLGFVFLGEIIWVHDLAAVSISKCDGLFQTVHEIAPELLSNGSKVGVLLCRVILVMEDQAPRDLLLLL